MHSPHDQTCSYRPHVEALEGRVLPGALPRPVLGSKRTLHQETVRVLTVAEPPASQPGAGQPPHAGPSADCDSN